MKDLIALIPDLLVCALFFIFLVLGLKFLLAARDALLERFGQIYFSLTQRSYDENSEISERTVVSLSRVFGAVCLILSAAGAWMIVERLGVV